MAYTATTWVDNTTPAITAAQLNRMEAGIVAAQPTGAALTADNAAIASTSLTAVSGLAVTMAANSIYVLEWDIDLTCATTTMTFGVRVSGPTGAAGIYDVLSTNGAPNTGAATVKFAGQVLGTAIASGQFGNPGSATAPISVRVRATIRTGATAGDATLALNGSTTGNMVVKASSSVAVTKVV